MKHGILSLFFLVGLLIPPYPGSAQSASPTVPSCPILIVVIDKIESSTFYHSRLPHLQRLFSESSLGLMNLRSGSGYGSNRGYLTLGFGGRAPTESTLGGVFQSHEQVEQGLAGEYLKWIFGKPVTVRNSLVVPEIGLFHNQTKTSPFPIYPGMLGSTLRKAGWTTAVLGNSDSIGWVERSAGMILMDRRGRLDAGRVERVTNQVDPKFPYLLCFNREYVVRELVQILRQKSLVIVEFGDFARLDRYREAIKPSQYQRNLTAAWKRLDDFIGEILVRWSPQDIKLMLITPSLSKEAIVKQSFLGPIAVRGKSFPPNSILTSASTRWNGLVANVDVVPTLIEMTGSASLTVWTGRPFVAKLKSNALRTIQNLNGSIILSLRNRRAILDVYIYIISAVWLGWLLTIRSRFGFSIQYPLLVLGIVPLGMLLFRFLPTFLWNLWGFLFSGLLLGFVFYTVPDLKRRWLWIAGITWLVLTLDQMTGWGLIRFSPLGYSPAGGSRYYGIGNEFVGIYLATALVVGEYWRTKTGNLLTTGVVFSLTLFVLGWPKFGADFGGVLAAIVGFGYYISRYWKWRWNNLKTFGWIAGIIIAVILITYADSFRDSGTQSHIGRYLGMLESHRGFNEGFQMIVRKVGMNIKLINNSSWTRILILALVIGILHRNLGGGAIAPEHLKIVWKSLLITGVTALVFNDSGIIAFAICMAWSFSYFLSINRQTKTEV